jgi:micrococcal nuclease
MSTPLRRFLVALVLLAGCGTPEAPVAPEVRAVPPGVPEGAQEATVSRHIDGDTIWVAVDEAAQGPLPPADDHRVRLLQVDSPEVAGSPAGEQCYGPEASAFTAAELPIGTRVWLEVDTAPRDRFDRNLRYVWLADGTLFNERLVEEGYAEAVLFEPNDARIATMRAAEERARRQGRGLWGACR